MNTVILDQAAVERALAELEEARAFGFQFRRRAEEQALALLDRTHNAATAARILSRAAEDCARLGSEPVLDFAATLRVAAALAAVRALSEEVKRLGGDPEKLLGRQP